MGAVPAVPQASAGTRRTNVSMSDLMRRGWTTETLFVYHLEQEQARGRLLERTIEEMMADRREVICRLVRVGVPPDEVAARLNLLSRSPLSFLVSVRGGLHAHWCGTSPAATCLSRGGRWCAPRWYVHHIYASSSRLLLSPWRRRRPRMWRRRPTRTRIPPTRHGPAPRAGVWGYAHACVFIGIFLYLTHKAKVQEEEEVTKQDDEAHEEEPVPKRPKLTMNDEEIKKKQLEKKPTVEVYFPSICGPPPACLPGKRGESTREESSRRGRLPFPLFLFHFFVCSGRSHNEGRQRLDRLTRLAEHRRHPGQSRFPDVIQTFFGFVDCLSCVVV